MKATKNLLTATALLFHAAFVHAETIEMPTDFQVEAVYRHLANLPPDFERAARETQEYRNASEFDRSEVLARQIEALRAEFSRLSDVDAFVIRARTSLSEYDSEKGAYYIEAFRPGTYYPFGRYSISMENGEEFREWLLPVEEAREVRDAVGSFGSVITEITIRPFASSPGGEGRIRGQVTAVKIFADDRLLHEEALPTEAYLPISMQGGTTNEEPVSEQNLTVSGIPLGAYLEETEMVLAQEGYSFFEGAPRGEQYGYRPIGFSTDEATLGTFKTSSRDRTATIYSNIMGGRSGPHYLAAVLGSRLDCHGQSDALEKCGYLFARDSGQVDTVIHMQQALGVSEKTIMDALSARYGQPSDKIPAVIMGSYRGTMLVWGLSNGDLGETVPAISDISENRHWQVEASIVEPDQGRHSVIVQLNNIETGNGTTDPNTKIEF